MIELALKSKLRSAKRSAHMPLSRSALAAARSSALPPRTNLSTSPMGFVALCSPGGCPWRTEMSCPAMDSPATCTQRVEGALPGKISPFTSCRRLFPPVSATKSPPLRNCHKLDFLYTPPTSPRGALSDGLKRRNNLMRTYGRFRTALSVFTLFWDPCKSVIWSNSQGDERVGVEFDGRPTASATP